VNSKEKIQFSNAQNKGKNSSRAFLEVTLGIADI
jgi:hypothetical protein